MVRPKRTAAAAAVAAVVQAVNNSHDSSDEIVDDATDSNDDDQGSSSGEEDGCTPPALRADAELLRGDVLPKKSKAEYMKEYHAFMAWHKSKSVKDNLITSGIVEAYYLHLQKTYAASSLFSKMSMLKKTLFTEHRFALSEKCWATCTMSSRKGKKDQPIKKATIFQPEHLEKFVTSADVSPVVILSALLAWNGALRPSELYDIKTKDCRVLEDGSFEFSITGRKTTSNHQKSVWMVGPEITNWSNPKSAFEIVMAARKAYDDRNPKKLPEYLLMKMQDGKVHNMRVGQRQLGDLAKRIAECNKLEGNYTGYSFRRSSASALAVGGASHHQVRMHLGHRGLAVATEYIDESPRMMMDNARRLNGMSMQTTVAAAAAAASTTPPGFSNEAPRPTVAKGAKEVFFHGAKLNNCVINITTTSGSAGASVSVMEASEQSSAPPAKKQQHEE